jgi:hypothetical protein
MVTGEFDPDPGFIVFGAGNFTTSLGESGTYTYVKTSDDEGLGTLNIDVPSTYIVEFATEFLSEAGGTYILTAVSGINGDASGTFTIQ